MRRAPSTILKRHTVFFVLVAFLFAGFFIFGGQDTAFGLACPDCSIIPNRQSGPIICDGGGICPAESSCQTLCDADKDAFCEANFGVGSTCTEDYCAVSQSGGSCGQCGQAWGCTEPTQVCGNGVVEGTEQCDDGNTTSGDGCSAACTAEPAISVLPTSFTFTAQEGGSSPASQTLTVTNSGSSGSTLSWSASEAAAWLTLSSTNGTLASGASANVTLTANITGLTAANSPYGATITVSDPNAASQSVPVSVTLTITEPPPVCGNGVVEGTEQCDDGNTNSGDGCSAECVVEFCGDGIVQSGLNEQCDDGNTTSGDGCSAACTAEPAISVLPTSFTFTAQEGGSSPASQTLTVTNSGSSGSTLSWSASDDAGWLSVSPASGSEGSGASDSVTVTVDTAGLSAGIYTGTITVSDPNAANGSVPVTVTLTITAAPSPQLDISQAATQYGWAQVNLGTLFGSFLALNIGDDSSSMTYSAGIACNPFGFFSGVFADGGPVPAGSSEVITPIGEIMDFDIGGLSVGNNLIGCVDVTCTGIGECQGEKTKRHDIYYHIPGPSCALYTDKVTVLSGGDVTLSWTSVNTHLTTSEAVAGYSGAGFSPDGPVGAQTITMNADTTFTLKVKGLSNSNDDPANFYECSAKVNVVEPPTCSPSRSSVGVGENVLFLGEGGYGGYTWEAPEGSPSSGLGARFSTQYATAGTKSVTVNSFGASGTCSVEVTPPVPALSVSPTSLSFSASEEACGFDPSPQTITVTNTGDAGSILDWTANENASWLTVSPANGSLPAGASAQITVNAAISGLAAGPPYTAPITVSASGGAANSSQTVTVTFVISECTFAPTCSLTANPSSGFDPLSGTLTWITNNDPTSCTASGGWSGEKNLNGGSQPYGPVSGDTTYTLTCSNTAGSGECSAAVTILPPPQPTISTNLDPNTATVQEGVTTPIPATLIITNTGSSPSVLNWSVSSDASWLTLAPPAGSTLNSGESVSISVTVDPTGLLAGGSPHVATITVSDPNATNDPQTELFTLIVEEQPPPPQPKIEISPPASVIEWPRTSFSGSPSVGNVGDVGSVMNYTGQISYNPYGFIHAPLTGNLAGGAGVGEGEWLGGFFDTIVSELGVLNVAADNVIGRIEETCTGVGTCKSPTSATHEIIYTGIPTPECTLTADDGNGPSAGPIAVEEGTSVTLGWDSTYANPSTPIESFSGAGFSPSGASGSQTVTVNADEEFTLTVQGLSNNKSDTNNFKKCSVVVNAIPPSPGQPAISLSPTSFSFTAQEGGVSPPAQTLTITNSGDDGTTLNWTAAGDTSWLLLDGSGTVTGNAPKGTPSAVQVSVDISGLTAANSPYTATITVSDPSAFNNPVTASVSLDISVEPRPKIDLSKLSRQFSWPLTTLNDSFLIENVGDPGSSMDYEGALSSNPYGFIDPLSGDAAGGSGVLEGGSRVATFTGAMTNVSKLDIGSDNLIGAIAETCTDSDCKTPIAATYEIYYEVPSPTCELTANGEAGSLTVSPGTEVELAWTSTDANQTKVDPIVSFSGTDFSPWGANGDQTVTVNADEEFTLTVQGLSDGDTSPRNFATCSVTVLMEGGPGGGGGPLSYSCAAEASEVPSDSTAAFEVVPFFAVSPASWTMRGGEQKKFEALFDEDGSGPLPPQDITDDPDLRWRSSDASIVSHPAGAGPGMFEANADGEALITATYRELVAGAEVTVASCTLTATPSSASVGDEVSFSVSGETVSPDRYQFIYGDGGSSDVQEGSTVTHAYGAADVYTAAVELRDCSFFGFGCGKVIGSCATEVAIDTIPLPGEQSYLWSYPDDLALCAESDSTLNTYDATLGVCETEPLSADVSAGAFSVRVRDVAGTEHGPLACPAVTVTGGPPPPPPPPPPGTPSCTFTANPSVIAEKSETGSVLEWTCSNAASCAINKGIGSVNPVTGSVTVTPANTTTYTLTCTSPSDKVAAFSATVQVGEGGRDEGIPRF